jgi:hypothetical protein
LQLYSLDNGLKITIFANMMSKTLLEKVVDIYNKDNINEDDIKKFNDLTAMFNREVPVQNVKFSPHPSVF